MQDISIIICNLLVKQLLHKDNKIMAIEKKFVWIDLEMTGLSPENDVILEIATTVTDGQLNIIAQGPSYIIWQPEDKLTNVDPWITKTFGKPGGLLDQSRRSPIRIEFAKHETFEFIKKHVPIHAGLLAGNSVWQDRLFLKRYMPEIIDYLNYRILDISCIKEVVRQWYPGNPATEFKKSENHRASEDVKESIEELKHYRRFFFIAS